MTIDEAIAKLRSNAIMDKYNMCGYSMEQHEQIAELLEELKEYRKHIKLTEIPEQYKLGFQDGIVNGFENGYNKAIDDFLKKALTFEDITGCVDSYKLENIAEQLKEGGENERMRRMYTRSKTPRYARSNEIL